MYFTEDKGVKLLEKVIGHNTKLINLKRQFSRRYNRAIFRMVLDRLQMIIPQRAHESYVDYKERLVYYLEEYTGYPCFFKSTTKMDRINEIMEQIHYWMEWRDIMAWRRHTKKRLPPDIYNMWMHPDSTAIEETYIKEHVLPYRKYRERHQIATVY